jgi:hypothetical protein
MGKPPLVRTLLWRDFSVAPMRGFLAQGQKGNRPANFTQGGLFNL